MNSDISLDIIRIASNLVLFTLLVNVVLCIFYRNALDVPFKRLFLYLIWNLIIEVLAILFIELGYNNLPLLHIYTLGEFLLFSYFYKSLIHKPEFFQNCFQPFIIVGSLLIIFNSVFFQDIFSFNTNSKSLVQILIIAYAVIYFFNQLEQDARDRNVNSLRLINSGIIIYYSASLFIFMYGFSIEVSDSYITIWAFNACLNLVFQILILCGIWIAYFRKRIS